MPAQRLLHTQVDPMLTSERMRELRANWAARAGAAQPAGALSLDCAFEALFTPDEREEMGYEGFLDDLRGFFAAKGTGELQQLTLAEALDFIEHVQ